MLQKVISLWRNCLLSIINSGSSSSSATGDSDVHIDNAKVEDCFAFCLMVGNIRNGHHK